MAAVVIYYYHYVNTAARETCGPVATPSEQNPYRKELDDMLHDLNILETIEQLTGQLRLQYEVTTTTSLLPLLLLLHTGNI